MTMRSVVVDKIASVTQALSLKHDLRISDEIPAEEGVVLVVEVLTNKSTYNTLELTSGNIQALTGTNDDESPSFAPNGKLIIYASRDQGRDVLMTSTLDGRIKTRLLSSGLDVREPVWGPFNR